MNLQQLALGFIPVIHGFMVNQASVVRQADYNFDERAVQTIFILVYYAVSRITRDESNKKMTACFSRCCSLFP